MKIVLFLFFILVFCTARSQNNYLVEYDKLSDKITYHKQSWVKGEQIDEIVESIHLDHNDIINVKVIKVNTFIFNTEMYMVTKEMKENSNSPLSIILKGFAGFSGLGGPAINLITSLASNPPNPVISLTRGDDNEGREKQQKFQDVIKNIHTNLLTITKNFSDYEQNVKVKFDKSLTQEEIIANLKQLINKQNGKDISEIYSDLIDQIDQLELLKTNYELDPIDPLWDDISTIEKQIKQFVYSFVDENGELLNVDLRTDLMEVENSDFFASHTFLAKRTDEYNYNLFSANEFVLLFKEIKGDDNEKFPIDFVKRISIPVRQPNVPSWSLGIDAVLPIGGISNYTVNSIQGDWSSPDSLLINENNANVLMSIGTKLFFDFPTSKSLIPSAMIGAAISGVNKPSENWNISFLLGGGISFKQIPYLSINAGFSFTQIKVLKDSYTIGNTFVKPTDIYYDDYSSLYKKSFKPGIFFGIGIRL